MTNKVRFSTAAGHNSAPVIQHQPWVGPDFERGIDGQTYLLFGYSHYGTLNAKVADDESFTVEVMKRWGRTGETPFFNAIASYFGFEDPAAFYDRVAFANVLPFSVGGEEDKFAYGEQAALDAVPQRVREIMRDVDADRAIVFSAKGWAQFPKYDAGGEDNVLTVDGQPDRTFGPYERRSSGYCTAYGLRHTMIASWDMMHQTVRTIMAHQPRWE